MSGKEECRHEWIESCLESSSMQYDGEGKQWVICRGFIERCALCKEPLVGGYGDVDFFATKELAEEVLQKDKQLIGK